MNNRISAEVFPPGEFLGDELEARGWTQTEFAEIIGRPQKLVNDIVLGKRGVTPETATAFAAALGTSAQLWMNLETAYQLSKVSTETGRITREAALRARFPVREMIKRGWIPANKSFDILEESVCSYFNIKSANDPISLPHAARRNYEENQLSVIQWAWIFRVNQLATALKVPKYSADKLRDAIPLLENLMSEPEEIRHVPKVLSNCGVRFVIVEPIPSSKIDGVCFWINESSPTIALSLKGDHIDKFWFNLWHEIEHVLRGDGKDAIVVDDFDDEESQVKDSEKAANAAAADHCVPTAQMKDFIARHTPMFSEKSVIGFARIMKRHPGIVVGQIQKKTGRWELFRKLQPRVRAMVIQSALTDGYGRTGPMNL
jgi:HTH-type transcriptional regulator / antitoxin HigA